MIALDWRGDKRRDPYAVLTLDRQSAEWIAEHLPDGDGAKVELDEAIHAAELERGDLGYEQGYETP